MGSIQSWLNDIIIVSTIENLFYFFCCFKTRIRLIWYLVHVLVIKIFFEHDSVYLNSFLAMSWLNNLFCATLNFNLLLEWVLSCKEFESWDCQVAALCFVCCIWCTIVVRVDVKNICSALWDLLHDYLELFPVVHSVFGAPVNKGWCLKFFEFIAFFCVTWTQNYDFLKQLWKLYCHLNCYWPTPIISTCNQIGQVKMLDKRLD